MPMPSCVPPASARPEAGPSRPGRRLFLLAALGGLGGALLAGRPARGAGGGKRGGKPYRQRLNETEAKRKVTAYLKARLRDGRSYQAVEWSRLVELKGEGPYAYAIRHRYWVQPLYGPRGWSDSLFLFDPEGEIAAVETSPPGHQLPDWHPYRP